jgi:hypothetical protein
MVMIIFVNHRFKICWPPVNISSGSFRIEAHLSASDQLNDFEYMANNRHGISMWCRSLSLILKMATGNEEKQKVLLKIFSIRRVNQFLLVNIFQWVNWSIYYYALAYLYDAEFILICSSASGGFDPNWKRGTIKLTNDLARCWNSWRCRRHELFERKIIAL